MSLFKVFLTIASSVLIGIAFLFFAASATARGYSENDFRAHSIGMESSYSGTVYTFCNDRVVCYDIDGGYNGSGSCFRDQDLVNKYCK